VSTVDTYSVPGQNRVLLHAQQLDQLLENVAQHEDIHLRMAWSIM
jgi:hypothetical protein